MYYEDRFYQLGEQKINWVLLGTFTNKINKYFKETASTNIWSFLNIFEKHLKTHINNEVKESDKDLFVGNKLDEFLLYSLYIYW